MMQNDQIPSGIKNKSESTLCPIAVEFLQRRKEENYHVN